MHPYRASARAGEQANEVKSAPACLLACLIGSCMRLFPVSFSHLALRAQPTCYGGGDDCLFIQSSPPRWLLASLSSLCRCNSHTFTKTTSTSHAALSLTHTIETVPPASRLCVCVGANAGTPQLPPPCSRPFDSRHLSACRCLHRQRCCCSHKQRKLTCRLEQRAKQTHALNSLPTLAIDRPLVRTKWQHCYQPLHAHTCDISNHFQWNSQLEKFRSNL